MTSKHYRLIAEALRRTGASHATCAALADALAADNPNFNARKFLEACKDQTND